MANRKTWVPVTNEPKERIWTVENLMTGHEYVFRIMAQNKYGVGDPLDSEPEIARNLYSEWSVTFWLQQQCLHVTTSVFLLAIFQFSLTLVSIVDEYISSSLT